MMRISRFFSVLINVFALSLIICSQKALAVTWGTVWINMVAKSYCQYRTMGGQIDVSLDQAFADNQHWAQEIQNTLRIVGRENTLKVLQQEIHRTCGL